MQLRDRDRESLTLSLSPLTCPFRTHAVTVLRGLVFDANEAEPLPLTHDALRRCVGGEYVDAVHRGYEFVPHARKRKAAGESEPRKAARAA